MIIDEENYFEHYGVKGMRWGVRNDDDETGISPGLKEKLTSSSKKLTPEQSRRVSESRKKHDAKFEKSEDRDPKGWRPTGKQVALAAAGAVVAGAVVYKLSTGKSVLPSGGQSFSIDDYKSVIRGGDIPGWIKSYANTKMSTADFKGITENSIGRIWSGNYITQDLFDTPEITFDAGHKFFRVSHAVENSFGSRTFATASPEDAARYFLGWKEKTTNMVNFNAKEPVKIPNLHTTLEAVRAAMHSNGEDTSNPRRIVSRLNALAGSDFSNPDGERVVNVLRSWGYHGVTDYMDAGVYGERPMVLFDNSRLSNKVTTLRENVDVSALQAILADLPNRR